MRSITSYLNKKLKSTQQTPDNKSDPKMSIQVSRARTTIMDSNYWTIETIREKEGLGDIALAPRRTKPYGPPNRIYEIHVEGGNIETAIREYPDYLKLGWQPQFELGLGSAVAIAFDAQWKMYRGKWRISTDEDPFIFWVDASGVLWSRLWDQQETLKQLASSVVKIKAIRGWRNINFADQDHGIVVAYIKTDGKVYYRNYCIQPDGMKVWETERQLIEFTHDATNINLFITNDYRLGIVVEDSQGKIHWYITKRNWAGMAIAPDRVNVRVGDMEVDFIPVNYICVFPKEIFSVRQGKVEVDLRYALTDNAFLEIYNQPVMVIVEGEETEDWGKELIVKTRYRLYNLHNADFEIADSFNRLYYPDIVEEINDRAYKLSFLEFNNFNNVDEVGELKFKGLLITNGVGVSYEPFEKTFYPLNLVPITIPRQK